MAERPPGPPAEADGLHSISRRQSVAEYLRDIWGRRDYIVAVPMADLRAKNYDTVLGNVWNVLNPLLQVGVYWLIFAEILKTDRGLDNFLTYLAVGVFGWQLISRSARQGATAITSNEKLIRSIRFPRAILPIAVVVEEVIAYIPAFFVLIFIAVITGATPQLSWLWLLAVLPVMFVFSLGLAFLTARFTHSFPDFDNALPFLLRMVFYLSGILYSVEGRIKSDTLKHFFNLNPVFSILELARDAIFGDPMSTFLWVSSVAWAIGLCVVGFLVFKSAEFSYGRS